MKVWEMMNNLKGANASKRQIEIWLYDNKVCPKDLVYELDLDEGQTYPVWMYRAAIAACGTEIDCYLGCRSTFLNSERDKTDIAREQG